MTKLTPSQRELLTLAARADNGAIETPVGDKAKVAALIKRGFLISVPQTDGPSCLLITDAGRAAIGPPAPQASDPTPKASTPRRKGKIGALIDLLGAEGGATIEAMMAATGWQAHSVRGAISGALKKKLGLTVLSEKVGDARVYRIVAGAGA